MKRGFLVSMILIYGHANQGYSNRPTAHRRSIYTSNCKYDLYYLSSPSNPSEPTNHPRHRPALLLRAPYMMSTGRAKPFPPPSKRLVPCGTSHVPRVVHVTVIPWVILYSVKEAFKIAAKVCLEDEDSMSAGSVNVQSIVTHGGREPRR